MGHDYERSALTGRAFLRFREVGVAAADLLDKHLPIDLWEAIRQGAPTEKQTRADQKRLDEREHSIRVTSILASISEALDELNPLCSHPDPKVKRAAGLARHRLTALIEPDERAA